jgi:hypothetical protein
MLTKLNKKGIELNNSLNPQEYFYCKPQLPVIVANAIKNLLTITKAMFALLFDALRQQ